MELQKRRKIGDYYPLYDGHGSVIALSDSNGAITDTYDYTPNGKIRNLTGNSINPYQYSGERTDSETGFQYLRARYYNFETGRFTTRDTWAGVDGNPVTLNKYLYGNGNPVRYVDRSGRFSLGEASATMSIQDIFIRSLAMVKLSGFLNVAIQTVWGIPWDKTAFKDPVAKLDGVSPSVGVNGVGFGIGIERLTPKNGSKNWYYWYIGASASYGPSAGLPANLNYYFGYVYDNRKDKTGNVNIDNYLGPFYTISTSAIVRMFLDSNTKFPLGVTVFSSGIGGGLYGYASNVGVGSFDFTITGAWSYYFKIGAGKNIFDTSDSPFWSSRAWNEAILKEF